MSIVAKNEVRETPKEEVREVPIEKIIVNPFQPRRHFAQNELEELAQSLKTVGMIHPPLVRPLPDGIYELVSGERRFRAAQLAGMQTIAVLVREGSNELSAQAALIENVQRV
ncbi:MAG: ParB/RepB/Spo0J family partition protein, partial [Parachlamydiaceae bacterium]